MDVDSKHIQNSIQIGLFLFSFYATFTLWLWFILGFVWLYRQVLLWNILQYVLLLLHFYQISQKDIVTFSLSLVFVFKNKNMSKPGASVDTEGVEVMFSQRDLTDVWLVVVMIKTRLLLVNHYFHTVDHKTGSGCDWNQPVIHCSVLNVYGGQNGHDSTIQAVNYVINLTCILSFSDLCCIVAFAFSKSIQLYKGWSWDTSLVA